MARPQREVRFEYLKGSDALRRLRRKPLGYLPLGSLERHGEHLPIGLDILKAHAICCQRARKTGGVVFPPHFYSAIHVENDRLKGRELAANRRQVEWWKREWLNLYTDDSIEEHLADVMRNLRTMGVRVLVLYTDHYPPVQYRMVRRLAARFNRGGRSTMRVVPFSERDFFGTGDHAGLWETSLFLATCPGHVDMDGLGPLNQWGFPWSSDRDPRQATAEFGQKAIRKITAHLREETARLLRSSRAP